MNNGKQHFPGTSDQVNWRSLKGNRNRNFSNDQNRRLGHVFNHTNSDRNQHSREHYNAFGIKRLTEFLGQTNDEVIMALDKSINNFRQNLLHDSNNDVDKMVLLIQIVGEKICGDASIHEIQNNLVVTCTDPLFLEKILKFTSEIPSLETDVVGETHRNGNVDRCPTRILNALSAFYGRICTRMPVLAADKLTPYIQGARNISELLSLRGVLQKEMAIEIESRFENMLKDILLAKETIRKNSTEEFQKKIRKRQPITTEDREKLYQMVPVDDFCTMTIIPSKDEILSDEQPFLRPNLITGNYPSALTYLDVQFRLLREDFLAPLRESVKEYFLMNANAHDAKNQRPAPGTIRIYRDVELHKVQCTMDVTLFTMKFSTFSLKKVKWESSKRLLNGSLLLLTPDRFKSIYFATVGRREEKNLPHGLIDIIWEGNRPDTYDGVKFLMIECEVYFESYRHTLKALQIMAEPSPPHYDRPRLDTYRMSKYIVNVTKDAIPPPGYFHSADGTSKHINFGVVMQSNQQAYEQFCEAKEDDEKRELPVIEAFEINPLNLSDWPSATDLGMDTPQYVAFQSAMTQELALIQGPPGTGKTYIGLQIMKVLLANSLGPILVVCYTNHALDQFLEGILSIMNSLHIEPYGQLIRVGGQSKNEDIQQYNIARIRSEYLKRKQFEENYASLRGRTRRKLMLLEDYRADLKSLFSDLCYPNGIVNFTALDDQLQNSEMSADFHLNSIIHGEFEWIFLRYNGKAIFDFLRLNNYEFDSQKFSAEMAVKHLFRTRVSINRNTVESNERVETPEVELDDEELRNILVAHRMEEEILEEIRKYTAVTLKYHLHHELEGKFRLSENRLFSELEDAQAKNNYKTVRRIEGELYELGLQRNKFINQCNFVKQFMQNYKNGQIDLPKVTSDLLAKSDERGSVWKLSITEKWAIYLYFIDKIKKHLLTEIIKIEAKIIDAQRKMEEVKNQGDGIILQQAQVVGMTTTGAAKYNTVLRMMQSEIVIVEEAAEVLESHIITSITEHCQHLILIGDHQQLKPPTTVYKLAKDYQLDVSLFERLIKNDISWQYLRAQHRMRPEICKLLVPTIYPDLINHSNVYSYPPVKGLHKNVFFVNHSNPEKADNDSMTKSNEYEAKYVTQLCRYLMLQGYKSSQITILTTYIGQMFLIKRLKMAEGDTCRDVRVTVVDNFQGEENDIILLSLVRSNEENKIGFLRTDNRICVALSRAKHGLYIVGNMDGLVNSPSNTWKKICEELQEQESIGSVLKIQCQNHEEMIEINSPDEFRKKSPEGGCTKMCPGVLPRCDHSCRNICHIVDRTHEHYKCKEDCERHCTDAEKHKCAFVCHVYPCPRCEVKVRRNLRCGHVKDLPCHMDIVTYSCELLVPKQLKCGHLVNLPCSLPSDSHRCLINVRKDLGCGHTKLLPCHIPVTEYKCVEKVNKDLDCGHKVIMKCIDDPSKFDCTLPITRSLPCGHEQEAQCMTDVTSIQCLTMCDEVHPDCNHQVRVPCHQLNARKEWKCLESCDIRLNCGHQCVKTCHLQEDPDHMNYLCRKNCARSCENGHKCRKNHKCHEKCLPCNILTDKLLSCGHRIKASCSLNEETLRCVEPCRKTLSCGHECLKKCYVLCDPCVTLIPKKSIDCPHTFKVKCHQEAEKSICNELIASTKMSLCGHVVTVPCRISDTCSPEDCVQYCRRPCGYKFDYDGCGHECQGNCASCHQGKIHVKCNSKCERVLACGHVCKFPCSSLCPPCSDVCLLQCKHSKCKKKCGEPCTDCKEFCDRRCKHSKCQKKCSEMCDRNPCNEPCKKKMKCGHDCVGCCGEPCSPYCRICDKEIVQELFFGDEDKSDARFVYLEICGHIIHREAMDKWMSQNLEESDRHQITVKRCPKCSKTITNSARYGNVIKKHFQDVLGIRNKIFGNNQTQRSTQQVIAQKIQRHSNGSCQFENVREFLSGQIYQMKQSNTKRGREMVLQLLNVDQYTFETLHNIVLWWEEAENNVRSEESIGGREHRATNLLPDSRTELLKGYEKLFGILLKRKFPLSSHEIDDFDQEFNKMHDLYSLGLRRGIKEFDSFTGSLEMYMSARRHLTQNKPYDEDMQKTTQSFLKKLEDIIKVGWELVTQKRASDARVNRQNIFKAMGLAGNHWYRCSNGHLYGVGDCGALNQSGTCPECQTAIGRGAQNITAVRDEAAIQQQINSVVDIFPEENYAPPVFRDRAGNSNRNRPYRRRGRYTRGRY